MEVQVGMESEENVSEDVAKSTSKEVDQAITMWAKRLLLCFLLAIGIPTAAAVVIYALSHPDELASNSVSDGETIAGKCRICGSLADEYWYKIYDPHGDKFYVCQEHKYSNEVDRWADPYIVYKFIGMMCLVVIVGPSMLIKHRPKRPKIIPIPAAATGGPPSWFWLSVTISLFIPISPIAFYIAWRGHNAYQVGSPRRRWGKIALVWSGFFSVYLMLGLMCGCILALSKLFTF
jgi:hypothetical protein